MKIAVHFSGHLRYIDWCTNQTKSFWNRLKNLGHEIDFYSHTWSSKSEWEQIAEHCGLQFEKIVFDKLEEPEYSPAKRLGKFVQTDGQFYSLARSTELSQHKHYDIKVRYRSDLLIWHDNVTDDQLNDFLQEVANKRVLYADSIWAVNGFSKIQDIHLWSNSYVHDRLFDLNWVLYTWDKYGGDTYLGGPFFIGRLCEYFNNTYHDINQQLYVHPFTKKMQFFTRVARPNMFEDERTKELVFNDHLFALHMANKFHAKRDSIVNKARQDRKAGKVIDDYIPMTSKLNTH